MSSRPADGKTQPRNRRRPQKSHPAAAPAATAPGAASPAAGTSRRTSRTSRKDTRTETTNQPANRPAKQTPKPGPERARRDNGRGRVVGELRLLPKGFAFVDTNTLSVRIDGRHLVGLLDGDRVRVSYLQPRPGRFVASRVELLERARTEVVGTVRRAGSSDRLVLDPGVGTGELPLSGPRQPDGALVRARLDGDGVTFVERLGEPLHRFLLRHGFTTAPSRGAVDEARRLSRQPLERLGHRRDLSALDTFTIDADHSRDLDDALSVEQERDGALRVWVHISDVTELLQPGSRLDRDAAAAATSVYLPGLVRPMLPAVLSEERLSLLPGQLRDTLTVEMLIDVHGEVSAVDVYESRIRSTARLSYVTVARFLAGRPVDLPDRAGATLSLLHVAASRLGFARRARGGSAGLLFDESFDDGPDTEIAHTLVERLMVAANESVGAFLLGRALPGVYRVHDEPTIEDLAELVERFRDSPTPVLLPGGCDARAFGAVLEQFKLLASFDAFRDLAAAMLGSARYSHVPGPHFALGSSGYLHFTSPIRRYADVVVHRVIKAFLAGRRTPIAEHVALCEHISQRSTRSAWAERDARAFVALSEMATGRKVEAVVLSVNAGGARVRVESCPVVATVERRFLPAAGCEIGQRLRFVVSDADPLTGRFELRAQSRNAR